jgi:hypothetical protein
VPSCRAQPTGPLRSLFLYIFFIFFLYFFIFFPCYTPAFLFTPVSLSFLHAYSSTSCTPLLSVTPSYTPRLSFTPLLSCTSSGVAPRYRLLFFLTRLLIRLVLLTRLLCLARLQVWHQDTDTPMLTLQSSSPDTSTGGAADTNASPADSAVGDIDWYALVQLEVCISLLRGLQ